MKKLIVVIALLGLTGCSALLGSSAGNTDYTIEPIVNPDGTKTCCKATVHNSKDYESLKFKFIMKPDGTIEAVLDEKGVSASDPAAIAAENNKKMLDAINGLIPMIGDKE